MPHHQHQDKSSFFDSTHYQMIDVGHKTETERLAIAMGQIKVGEESLSLIKEKGLPKGDAVVLAEIAGINGAKNAYQSIPLCHPLALDSVRVKIELDSTDTVTVYCMAKTKAKTGVEMEALAGVQQAMLAIYDLVKMVEPAINILGSRLLVKSGGKQGLWLHPDGVPQAILDYMASLQAETDLGGIKVSILTISDRASIGQYEDESGAKLKGIIKSLGGEVTQYAVVGDNADEIKKYIHLWKKEAGPQIILTTGGTGISPKDKTYETIVQLCDESVPGLSELLRLDGARYTQYSWLSRSYAGIVGQSLIVSLPGSPKAIKQGMDALAPLLPHAVKMLQGKGHD